MPRPRPDRALRRAVAGLARLHPADLALILDGLEPAEKARIDVLIAGLDEPAPLAEPAEPVWTYDGVSPWLRARLEPSAKTRGSRDFFLVTEAARAALADAAAPFRTERPASGPGQSLLGRVWRQLAGPPA